MAAEDASAKEAPLPGVIVIDTSVPRRGVWTTVPRCDSGRSSAPHGTQRSRTVKFGRTCCQSCQSLRSVHARGRTIAFAMEKTATQARNVLFVRTLGHMQCTRPLPVQCRRQVRTAVTGSSSSTAQRSSQAQSQLQHAHVL